MLNKLLIWIAAALSANAALADSWHSYEATWVPMAAGQCDQESAALAKAFENAGAKIIEHKCVAYGNGFGSLLVSYEAPKSLPMTSGYVGTGFVLNLIDFSGAEDEDDRGRQAFDAKKGRGIFPSEAACATQAPAWKDAFTRATGLTPLVAICRRQFSGGVALRIDSLSSSPKKFRVFEGSFGQAPITQKFVEQIKGYLLEENPGSVWLATREDWRFSVAYWAKAAAPLHAFTHRFGNTHSTYGECRNEATQMSAIVKRTDDRVVALDCFQAKDIDMRPYYLSGLVYHSAMGTRYHLTRGPLFTSYAACTEYRDSLAAKPSPTDLGTLCISDRGIVTSASYHAYFVNKAEASVQPPPLP